MSVVGPLLPSLTLGRAGSYRKAAVAVSFCPHVRLADGAAVFVVFPAKITTNGRRTHRYRKEALGDKLLLDLERCHL
jgi:hypothetical protein